MNNQVQIAYMWYYVHMVVSVCLCVCERMYDRMSVDKQQMHKRSNLHWIVFWTFVSCIYAFQEHRARQHTTNSDSIENFHKAKNKKQLEIKLDIRMAIIRFSISCSLSLSSHLNSWTTGVKAHREILAKISPGKAKAARKAPFVRRQIYIFE